MGRNYSIALAILFGGKSNLYAFFIVLVISLTLNVFLGWKVVSTPKQSTLKVAGMEEGTVLPLIPARHLNGDPAWITFEESIPTVVYVLSADCVWSRRNQENVAALATAGNPRFRFLGFSFAGDTERLARLRTYLESNPVPFEVFLVDNPGAAEVLRLDITPQMAIVGRGGTIEKVWVGAFDGSRRRQVEEFFAVELPGLTGDPSLQ